MNPLTQVKNLQKITAREAAAGVSEEGSWHAHYKDSAYVFIGGLPYDISEGDVLAIFAQYGEIMDLNLIRDKGTGKSKGFAFLAYEDQRSTILAVDNLNGTKVVGRTIRVDHVSNYKKKKKEDEEEEQRKREERGVCYAFQRGECNRGDACKFSHDEKRNANTGWGGKDDEEKWKHDRHEKRFREDNRHEGKFREDDRGEERGVCYAFQRGECNRGDACKFSHDEKRNGNTGWRGKDEEEKWKHDRHERRFREDNRHEGKFREDDRRERQSRGDDPYDGSRSRHRNSNETSRFKENDRSRSKEYDQQRGSR